MKLLGTTVEYFPYSTRTRTSPERWLPGARGNASGWSGIYPDVAAVMSRNLNFSLDLVAESKWGSMGEDGNWSGMIGGLQTRKYDVAFTGFSAVPERYGVIDFLGTAVLLNVRSLVVK